MGIFIWYLVGVKYYSHEWVLHTTGLLKDQRTQKIRIEGQAQSPKPKRALGIKWHEEKSGLLDCLYSSNKTQEI
jgi:hypothetical protein